MSKTKRRGRRKGGFLMTVGLLLIAAALLLTIENIREQKRADEAASAALEQLLLAIPQTVADEPQTLLLTDESGNLLDWPLDAQGVPMPWPVGEDGVPAASVTDGAGRVIEWAQIRAAAVPAEPAARAEAPDSPEAGQAATGDSAGKAEGGQAELSGWTVDERGSLLPWIEDEAGRLTAWPTDSQGHALPWSQLRQTWSKLLDVLFPYLALAAGQPPFVVYPDMEMPTEVIDGQTYIGVVEVPSLELSLPVISEWSYPRLKKAPCRYVGSIYSKDMIICGHNYDRHFGRLKDLVTGDEVRFTDVDGNVFIYSVCAMETLAKNAVEEMEAGEWDLTLFTCTKGGLTRVTVRCKLERYIVNENNGAI